MSETDHRWISYTADSTFFTNRSSPWILGLVPQLQDRWHNHQMWWWIPIAVAMLVAAGYGLHRLGLWLDDNDWLYYRKGNRAGTGSLAVMRVMQLYQPDMEHVIEETESVALRAEQDDEGDGRFRFVWDEATVGADDYDR